MIWIKDAWNSVTPSTIKNCFKKAGFPGQGEEEIEEQVIDMMPQLNERAGETFSVQDFVSADDDIEVRESAAASDSNHFDSDTDLDEEDEVMEEEEEVRKTLS